MRRAHSWSRWRAGLLAALTAGLAGKVFAFALLDSTWPDGTVTMELGLQSGGPSAQGLGDGATSWNQVAQAALAAWNTHIHGTQLGGVNDSNVAPVAGNGRNNVFWAREVYGEALDEYTLGITLIDSSDDEPTTREADVIFNVNAHDGWNSYRGPLRVRGAVDFQRVAVHEFGHVLGLDHPDRNNQYVTALMNSTVGDLDGLAADDIRGITYLYGPKQAPVISVQPADQVTVDGGSATFSAELSGRGPLSYIWQKDGVSLGLDASGYVGAGTTPVARYTNSFVNASSLGAYRIVAANPYGVASSAPAKLTFSAGITQRPVDQAVIEGDAVSFAVAATGSAITYQWQRMVNGVLKDMPEATGPSLIIRSVRVADAGLYVVQVTADGKIYSASATLTVKLGFAEQPQSQGVDVGGSATFSAGIVGTPRLTVPLSMIMDATGGLYVGDSSIRRVGAEGELATLGSNLGGQILARNSAGTFFSASAAGYAVFKLPPGGPLLPFAGQANQAGGNRTGWVSGVTFGGIYGLAVAADDTLYVADQAAGVIQKISPAGWVSAFVGNGSGRNSWSPPPASVDGTGDAARFGNLQGLAVDRAGNLYASDKGADSGLIRKITPAGVVTTLAGNSTNKGQVVDGTGSNAAFWKPGAVGTDAAGNVYVADAGTIRRITPDGVVTTIAGTANSFGYKDAPGSAARFSSQILGSLVVTGDGAVYVGDSLNYVIRKIAPDGTVSTLAGEAGTSGGADGSPLAYQWLFNGQPIAGATGPTLTIANAQLSNAGGYALRVTNSIGTVTSTAATLGFKPTILLQPVSTAAMLGERATVSVKAVSPTGRPLTYQWRRWETDIPGATNSTFTISHLGASDYSMYSVAVSDGEFTTVSASVTIAIALQLTQALPGTVTSNDGSSVHFGVAVQSSEEPAFNGPMGLTLDRDGNLYLADAGNHTIRKLSPQGVVSTVAGQAREYGGNDGAGRDARFYYPTAIAAGADGSLYVADTAACTVRKIGSDGTVSTLAGLFSTVGGADGKGSAARFNRPAGIACGPAGVVYVSDTGNHTIRQIAPDGSVTLLAGQPGVAGRGDGLGGAARFNSPLGLAVDGAGSIYVADGNATIRKITPTGLVSTLAGKAGETGSTDGPASVARFVSPVALAMDAAGYLWVADRDGNAVRRVSPQGDVSWAAGYALYQTERIDAPQGVTVDAQGRVYVTAGHALWRVAVDGISSLLAGKPGSWGYRDGTLTRYQWRFNGADIPGATSSVLVLNDIQAPSAGTYAVVMSNAYGSLTSESILTAMPTAPWNLVFDYTTRTVNPGEGVAFSVSAVGTGALSYQWLKNGTPLPGATAPTFSIASVQLADQARYAVTVTNAIGSTTTHSAALNVTVPGVPVITSQPTNYAWAESGYPISIGVVATGPGSLTYQWAREGVDLPGATANVFALPHALAADSGTYTVTVSNANGSVVSAVTFVYVKPAQMPYFSSPPRSATVFSGNDYTLDAGVSFINSLTSYQWAKNGVAIPGATRSQLLFTPVTSADQGSYSVTVTTDAGSVTSTPAVLTVVLPSFSRQPQSQTVGMGENIFLDCGISGGSAPRYQWRRNGRDLPGATNWNWAGMNAQPADTGLYTAALAEVTSEAAIVGMWTARKVIGAGEELQPVNIRHPNGNTFDQVLLTGVAEVITADYDPDPAKNQITRTSFVDLDDDIVQVEFSGPGTLSLVLDNPTGPAAPVNYNQATTYMKGHAGIVIAGATEQTNVSVFSVGKVTAVNQALFKDGVKYDGIADLAFIAIRSSNGKFGGVRTANANYFAMQGLTGLYAPGVAFQGPVFIGNITAFDAATPVIRVGAVSDARITGGDLAQANGAAVQVSGLTQLKFMPGGDSHGIALPAQANKAVLKQNGIDVTAQVVVNP